MHSHEGRWTPGGRGDFAATTKVSFLVSHGGSRDQVRQAMSRRRVRKFRDHWERRSTGGDLAKFCVSTSCS